MHVSFVLLEVFQVDNASHGYHAIALDIKVELDDGCFMGTRMVKKIYCS